MYHTAKTKTIFAQILAATIFIASCTPLSGGISNTLPETTSSESLATNGLFTESNVPQMLNANGERVYHFNHGDLIESQAYRYDANNNATLLHTKTYQAVDIGDDNDFKVTQAAGLSDEAQKAADEKKVADYLKKLENTAANSVKSLLFLPVKESIVNDTFKNTLAKHPHVVPQSLVTPDKLVDFLKTKWDEHKSGVPDKGVNGKDFLKLLNDHNLSVERFFYLYENADLTLAELESLLGKVSAISSTSQEEATELVVLLRFMNISWKQFVGHLESNGSTESKFLDLVKTKGVPFSKLMDVAKKLKNNPPEAVKAMLGHLNTAGFGVKAGADTAVAVANTALEFAKFGFEVTQFVLTQLQTNSFETESGKIRVIGEGDNALTNYINSHDDQSDAIRFHFIDVSPVPYWDKCAWKLGKACVGGIKFKPLNATILDVEAVLRGSCDAQHRQFGGHFIPAAQFRVTKNQQKYPAVNGTLKVAPYEAINVSAKEDELNPYFQLYITADMRFLGIKWDGVTSNNMSQTMTVVGGDRNSKHCFFNSDISQDNFR